MSPTFAVSPPLPRLPLRPPRPSKAHPPRMSQPPSPPRRPLPPTRAATTTSLSPLQFRSLLTLRGLSDLSVAAVLHELSTRPVLGLGVSAAASADFQLLLGGLIGVWTAAAFAQRLRARTAALITESADLPHRWDAAYVYRPALDADDAAAAVAWLSEFDEMEGPAAAALLRSLADADAPRVRAQLARALAGFPTRSNAALAVLNDLRADEDRCVRDAARDALTQFRAAGMLLATKAEPRAVESDAGREAEADMAAVLDRLFEDTPAENELGVRERGQTAWVLDAVAERVEAMGSVALSRPDLGRLGAANAEDGQVGSVEPEERKVQVPLFEGLMWEEMHGLCTLALVPAAYELLSVVDGGNLPLRFVGLGWLLAVGGLVAYPQSGELWRWFKKTLDDGSVGMR